MYIKDQHKIWVATGENKVYIEPSMANRHGLIAGATGTGKTVTLKVIAESFSDMGVPVFLADIKGDLSGMCKPGSENKHIRRSIDTMGLTDFGYTSYPVEFWDVYGRHGLPVRTTVSEMGPDLLARLLGLNDTQSGVLRIIFRIADEGKQRYGIADYSTNACPETFVSEDGARSVSYDWTRAYDGSRVVISWDD